MIKLGFIGFGEAAFCICDGLKDEGVTGMVAYDTMMDCAPNGELINRRAAQANVTLLPSTEDVVTRSEIIILSVPSTYVLDACRSAVSVLRPGQIFADVSTTTPNTKMQEWEMVKNTGVLFSDSAMLGSLPLSRHKVPIVSSGNGAVAFRDALTPYGMNIEVTGDNPGEASAIKLIRSIFMKGLAALMFETLEGSEAYNVSEQVIRSISSSLDGIEFRDHLNRLVVGTAIHAHRRAIELEGSINMLEESGLCSIMTEASRLRHVMLEPYELARRFIDRNPNKWEEIFEIMQSEKSSVRHS